MSNRFDGKVALVTGAGSGIGRAVALRLAADGARVLAVDVVEDRAVRDRSQLRPTLIVSHVADIADAAACAAAVGAAIGEFGRLDVLANVAGIFHAGHFTDHTPEQYRRVLAVNLDGPFFLSQAAIPHLLETGGNIVNVVSNSAIQGVPVRQRLRHEQGRAVAAHPRLGRRIPQATAARQRRRTGRYAHQPRDECQLSRRPRHRPGSAAWAASGASPNPTTSPAVVAFLASDEATRRDRRRLHRRQRTHRQLKEPP